MADDVAGADIGRVPAAYPVRCAQTSGRLASLPHEQGDDILCSEDWLIRMELDDLFGRYPGMIANIGGVDLVGDIVDGETAPPELVEAQGYRKRQINQSIGWVGGKGEAEEGRKQVGGRSQPGSRGGAKGDHE